ncbi:protein of unknown function [Xenorhabdus nematophila AN6/1]|nr:hypothetical protein XNA1_4520009 [Xenorhabdus nematophila str. Anatoliense]CEF30964.1 hypothetical protein XNW1_30009 [Xenorhabdus nematophila str. Websteri]CEF33549.1 hypothetical protein XNW1_4800009 [Xenorhabdus nematophila str. Websteri]CEK21084.1 protein of unknown function [Xenorhabdus nematophila AN6/1]
MCNRGGWERGCRRTRHTASADLKELPSADLHGDLLTHIAYLHTF